MSVVDIFFSPAIRSKHLKGTMTLFDDLSRVVGKALGRNYSDTITFVKETQLDYQWIPF